ncbi:MAG: hypothetical protein M0Z59_08420 [Nitrospiraceae bacterium]|nr:hypothetical protein [Nitrospiraceae bacterium]
MLGWIKGLFCLGVLGLAVYAGLQFGKPYFEAKMFKADVKEMVHYETSDPGEVKARILDKARQMDIPIADANLTVEGKSTDYRARGNWSVTVNIFDQYKKQLNFSFDSGQ